MRLISSDSLILASRSSKYVRRAASWAQLGHHQMIDWRKALKDIELLSDVAADSDDLEIVRKHLEMIKRIANRTRMGDAPQTPIDQPRRS
jgi:hypothetical protein